MKTEMKMACALQILDTGCHLQIALQQELPARFSYCQKLAMQKDKEPTSVIRHSLVITPLLRVPKARTDTFDTPIKILFTDTYSCVQGLSPNFKLTSARSQIPTTKIIPGLAT